RRVENETVLLRIRLAHKLSARRRREPAGNPNSENHITACSIVLTVHRRGTRIPPAASDESVVNRVSCCDALEWIFGSRPIPCSSDLFFPPLSQQLFSIVVLHRCCCSCC